MKGTYKPDHYNALSPQVIVDGAERMTELPKTIYPGGEKRTYRREDGSIVHAELRLDDSVIMIADSTPEYPSNQCMLHH